MQRLVPVQKKSHRDADADADAAGLKARPALTIELWASVL